jgi:hypothetical protein
MNSKTSFVGVKSGRYRLSFEDVKARRHIASDLKRLLLIFDKIAYIGFTNMMNDKSPKSENLRADLEWLLKHDLIFEPHVDYSWSPTESQMIDELYGLLRKDFENFRRIRNEASFVEEMIYNIIFMKKNKGRNLSLDRNQVGKIIHACFSLKLWESRRKSKLFTDNSNPKLRIESVMKKIEKSTPSEIYDFLKVLIFL